MDNDSTESGWFHVPINVVLVDGLEQRLAFASTRTDAVKREQEYCDEANDCNKVTQVAVASVGIVGNDVSGDEVTSTTFGRTLSQLNVRVELQTVSTAGEGRAPYLVKGMGCIQKDGGVAENPEESSLDVTINAGERQSEGFAVCASGYGGTYRLAARVEGDIELGSSVIDLSIPDALDGVLLTKVSQNGGEDIRQITFSYCGGSAADPTSGVGLLRRLLRADGSVVTTPAFDSLTYRTAELCGPGSGVPVSDTGNEDGGTLDGGTDMSLTFPMCNTWTAVFEQDAHCPVQIVEE